MLTERQKQLRKGRIGSSDVPTVMGCSLYGDNLLRLKQRILYGSPDVPPNLKMRRGALLESSVVRIAAEELGLQIVQYPGETIIGEDVGLPKWYVDTVDAICRNADGEMVLLEIKCTNRPSSTPPQAYIVQSLYHLAGHREAKCCHIVTFSGLESIGYYELVRNESEITTVLNAVGDFYYRFIECDEAPPEPTKPTTAEASADVLALASEVLELNEQIRELQERKETLSQKLTEILQSNHIERLEGENLSVTLKTNRIVRWKNVAEALNPDADLIQSQTTVVSYPLIKRRGVAL